MLEQKQCPRCNDMKPFSAFSKNKVTKTGRASWCRACRAEYKRGRYNPSDNSKWRRYYVVYDPLDSFGERSSFTRQEIDDMLHEEYLAIGTLFRRADKESRVSDDLRLVTC